MKCLILLICMTILSTSYAEDPIDALYTKEDRIVDLHYKSGPVKETYPAEMCNVLKSFHRALAVKDYDKALSLCSKEMVAESKEDNSCDKE